MALILAGSYLLRLVLAHQGGQDYWPDESRYQGSQYAIQHLDEGNWPEVGRWLFSHADHSLFRWVGLPAAAWEHYIGRSPFLVSAYFSLFSVLAIYLVWRIALRAGASEREALSAAFLLACANSFFYFARHYFPYDSAICIVLFGVELALSASTRWRSFVVGCLAGLGFLAYNGYWLMSGCLVMLHAIRGLGPFRDRFIRTLWAGSGLAATIGGFVGTARILGYDLITAYGANAGTISQGDFGIGYRLIPEYLWKTEGLLSLVWAGALAVAVVLLVRRPVAPRLAHWMAMIGFILCGLILLSDMLSVFVVYGRLVRQLVPFLCLVTAFVIERWAVSADETLIRRRMIVGGAVCLGIASLNFAAPLTQRFPRGFSIVARDEAIRRQANDGSVYRTIGTGHLWGVEVGRRLPAHQVMLRERHPLQFEPYQFEGFSAVQREEFRKHDVSMRLIRLPLRLPAAIVPGAPHVGPLVLKLRFPANGIGTSEPLVTTGVTGAGDMIYVNYSDVGHIRIGVDRWGAGGMLTEPIPIDYSIPHEVVISLDPLLHPAEGTPTAERLMADGLRERLVVAVDGDVVLSYLAVLNPVRRAEISLGANRIGMTSALEEFSGEFMAVRYATREEATMLNPSAQNRLPERDPEWEGYSGPVAIKLRLPEQIMTTGMADPLLVTGVTGAGDFVNLNYLPDGRAQIGFDHWGLASYLSAPFVVEPGREYWVTVSAGFLMPPVGSRLYTTVPAAESLRNRVIVRVDNEPVLDVVTTFHPTLPAQVVLGQNRIGGSTTGSRFSGSIAEARLVDLTEFR